MAERPPPAERPTGSRSSTWTRPVSTAHSTAFNPHLEHLTTRAERCRSPRLLGAFKRAAEAIRRRESLRLGGVQATAWQCLPPRGAFDTGAFLLGHAPDGSVIALSEVDLNGLSLVIGLPDVGKSLLLDRTMETAVQRGLWVLGVDTKNATGATPRHGLPVLDASAIALSLDAPPGCEPRAFVQRILTALEQSLYLHSGSTHILDAWQDERDRLGGTVCLAQVLGVLEGRLAQAKSWSKASQHLDSAVNALRRLGADTPLFAGAKPLPWSRRLAHAHVLGLCGQPAEAIRVAVLTYLEAFLAHVTCLTFLYHLR